MLPSRTDTTGRIDPMRALVRNVRRAVVLTAVTAIGVGGFGGSSTAGADEAGTTVQQLFVQNAAGGSLQPVKGKDGVYTLTLRGVSPTVTSFSDRPVRVASKLDIDEFLQPWNGGSFEDVPPNAALVISNAPESRDTFIFELAEPELDGRELTYQATLIESDPTRGLTGFNGHIDLRPPTTFGPASLFVDALPSSEMTVTISGVPAASLGGFIVGGFTETASSQVEQGDVTGVYSARNGALIATAADQQGTATVKLEILFCVPSGQSTANVSFSGSPAGTTVSFDLGNGAQTFTGSGTLEVPAQFQLADCGT
jgi:hypothetical protein